jgi:hypothetical protein
VKTPERKGTICEMDIRAQHLGGAHGRQLGLGTLI